MWKFRSRRYNDVVFFNYYPCLHIFKTVYIWDLDKTYLDTQFQNIKDLVQTAMERPSDKKTIPGAQTLIKLLCSEQKRLEEGVHPLIFVTASPPQIERKLISKLDLDGLNPVGLVCRDFSKYISPRNLSYLRRPLDYKLKALLILRTFLASDVSQVMWGDDSEFDPLIYSLYSDICSGRLKGVRLRKVLESVKARPNYINDILDLQKNIPEHDPIERIYINLAEDTDIDYYNKFGNRVLPCSNSLQMAVDLYQRQSLSLDNLVTVGLDLMSSGFHQDQLASSLDDLALQRALVDKGYKEMEFALKQQNILPMSYSLEMQLPVEMDNSRWVVDSSEYLRQF